ncbi:hypothetical protein [Nonomuraea glycinis]|uniref:hypothetical protein n=1 Tax=Nonomuraea glycinis TaxID=2047744 RepID=UPI0033B2A65D
MPDQTVPSNAYSPYATATLTDRHLLPSFFGAYPLPGKLALAACERMTVAPGEQPRELDHGNPQPGLCRACVDEVTGVQAPARQEPQVCQECGEIGSQGRWCALCRQELHDEWWANRDRMKAITVYQPWAWAIGRAAISPTGKTIENRPWPTRHRGMVAIHAGKKWDRDGATNTGVHLEWSEHLRAVPDRRTAGAGIEPGGQEFPTSAIIAVANLAAVHHSSACVRTSHLADLSPDSAYTCSPWAAGGAGGMYHWELANVRLLDEPVPCAGKQKLWDVPDDARPRVLAQLGTDTPKETSTHES